MTVGEQSWPGVGEATRMEVELYTPPCMASFKSDTYLSNRIT